MKLRFLTILLALGTLAAFPAFALDLHSARNTGIVGEALDGYVVAIQHSADADALVSEVNAKRKEEYTRISKANGQPVDVVAKLAAVQIINGLKTGDSYMDADGNWKKK